MTLTQAQATTLIVATLAAVAIPAVGNQFSRALKTLIGALGTRSIAVPQSLVLTKSKEQARAELAATVLALARKRNRSLLFHYTSMARAEMIMGTQQLLCGPAYRGHLGGGTTFPAGAYATDIPPWSAGTGMTQMQLSALFYGGNTGRDVSWWVAVDGEEFNRVFGSLNQYVRQCPEGDMVNVDAFASGPNLMDP